MIQIQQKKTKLEKLVAENLDEIRQFIEKTITTGENRDEPEFWEEFDDRIDILFTEDDDDASPFFGTMRFYAYPLKKDGQDKLTTDTSEFVLIKMR